MQRGERCATPYAPTAATTVTRISIWDHFSHRDALKGLLRAGSACPLLGFCILSHKSERTGPARPERKLKTRRFVVPWHFAKVENKKVQNLPELRIAAFGHESCAKRAGGANRLLAGVFPFRSPCHPRDSPSPVQRPTGFQVFMDVPNLGQIALTQS